MNFSKLGSSLILGSFVALSFLPLANQPANASLNCEKVERFGSKREGKVLNGLNEIFKGRRYKLRAGRKLKIREVKSAKFQKCKLNFITAATLQRVRKNGQGTAQVVADVYSIDRKKKEICYRNAKIVNVKLSRTGGNMEAAVKRNANKKSLPDQACISLKK
ncbi:MAG: hypothetical protein AAF378_12935 [Cyanobacteria bacterium P01_A01_bin.84]